MRRVVLLLLIAAAAGFGDVLVTGTTPPPYMGWQDWAAANANNNGTPYWDNQSLDGGNKNIGHCLTTGNCGLTNPPGALDYWGQANGLADPSFFFERNADSSQAAFQIEISALANFNSFGWYDVDNPTTLHEIFSGASTAGATAIFTPTDNYGFYMRDSYDKRTWYTQSSLNNENQLLCVKWIDFCGFRICLDKDPVGPPMPFQTGDQHFAVFAESLESGAEKFWIAMEDLPFKNVSYDDFPKSDRDYNDLVVTVRAIVSPEPVPEPATMLLMGVALAACAVLSRKRLRRR